ncbi:MAG: iron-containing redox enzyme family protein [Colwellia sp.]|nr:iron-containing redox enzyme family protein [Colwellia sp.]
MIKNNTLKHFERLSNNMHFMAMGCFHANDKFKRLVKYPEVYIENLIVNFTVTSSSTPLMQEVIRCAKLLPDDPTTQPLIEYMEHHIPEEEGHDIWCLENLEVLGISRRDVKKRIPSPNLATLIGSQYYWIRHHHPVAIMGYLLCMEVNHATVEYVENLINTSGLPAEAFSNLMHHARVDVHHKQEIIDMINNLQLTEEQYQMMETSAFQTYRYLTLITEDICKIAPIEQSA